jgi:hypothetical protein
VGLHRGRCSWRLRHRRSLHTSRVEGTPTPTWVAGSTVSRVRGGARPMTIAGTRVEGRQVIGMDLDLRVPYVLANS